MKKKIFSTKMIVTLALLLAIEIVLSRFLSIQTSITRIGFGFVPLVIAGVLFGPVAAAIVAVLGDVLGALLFPTGAFFPGLTVTACLVGLVYGLFLYKKSFDPKKPADWARIVILAIVRQGLLGLCLQSYWLSILWGNEYKYVFAARVPQCLFLAVVEIILIPILIKVADLIKKAVHLDTADQQTRAKMTKEEAISYIENYGWSTTKLGLERTQELLHRVGDPQKQLKFIHVAGSNGKGSTCAMLARILELSGYRVGMYISPYIEEFCERIQINGEYIDGDSLARITEYVMLEAEKMDDHPSQFELVTAIGMIYFLEQKVDIVVLEVGMGGALDSTNAIDAPEVAVITNIGLEHTEYLGNTLEEIAATKAGIIKTGCNAVCYDGAPEVTEVVKGVCAEKNVPLRCVDFSRLKAVSESLDGQKFLWDGREFDLALLGEHQLHNAATVLNVIEALEERGWKITDEAIKEGLKTVRWPARLEILGRHPLFVLDGGHNPQCAEALANSLDKILEGKKAVFLLGVLADKDYPTMMDMMIPYASEFVCLTPDSNRALPAADLAEFFRQKGVKAEAAEDFVSGIKIAEEKAGKDGTVVCFGSLYLAGHIRTEYAKLHK